jgi:hypothetical protein
MTVALPDDPLAVVIVGGTNLGGKTLAPLAELVPSLMLALVTTGSGRMVSFGTVCPCNTLTANLRASAPE